MAANKRNKFQAERDRMAISALYLKGKTLREIAEVISHGDGREYSLSVVSIHRDVKILQKRWVDMAVQNMSEAKGKELAKIDQLEVEAWDAWERSKRETKRSKTGRKEAAAVQVAAPGAQKVKGSDGKQVDSLEVWKEDQYGDPRFFTTIQWCIDKRCKLLGLDSPAKVDVSWLNRIEWDNVTEEQKRRLAAGDPVEKVLPRLIGNLN